jgi:GTP cyclohydrolase I
MPYILKIVEKFDGAHLAYVPHTKVIGLSKIARIVDKFSRKLQIQGEYFLLILQLEKN